MNTGLSYADFCQNQQTIRGDASTLEGGPVINDASTALVRSMHQMSHLTWPG
jgi:hypothetical protein